MQMMMGSLTSSFLPELAKFLGAAVVGGLLVAAIRDLLRARLEVQANDAYVRQRYQDLSTFICDEARDFPKIAFGLAGRAGPGEPITFQSVLGQLRSQILERVRNERRSCYRDVAQRIHLERWAHRFWRWRRNVAVPECSCEVHFLVFYRFLIRDSGWSGFTTMPGYAEIVEDSCVWKGDDREPLPPTRVPTNVVPSSLHAHLMQWPSQAGFRAA